MESANRGGVSVRFTEEPPTYADAIREAERLGGETTATFIGEIRTPKGLKIVPAPADRGDTMGNGYGVGGAFPAMLIVRTHRDFVKSAK